MLKIGHRGIAGFAPENTLASFAKAIDYGVDMIELDVHLSKDLELVVIHDDMLDRTTNGSGYVRDFTLAELQKLDDWQGEHIPTLQEVLDMVDKRVAVNIELREETASKTAEVIQEYLKKWWANDHFLVSSFNHHMLLAFKELLPDIRIGLLLSAIPLDYAACASEIGAYSINLDREYINQTFIDDAHHRNLQVYVWTVDHPVEIEKLTAMWVDGIITNYADRLID